METYHSFTQAYDDIARILKTNCMVAMPLLGAAARQEGDFCSFQAIWDTGATSSCITQAVVDAISLKPTGMTTVHGVQGVAVVETYLVNIALPNGVEFANVQVTKGILPGGADGDLLIGMDIIAAGDFAVTNKGGQTVFSFQTPSRQHIDFVLIGNAEVAKFKAWQSQTSKGPTGGIASTRQQRRKAERQASKRA